MRERFVNIDQTFVFASLTMGRIKRVQYLHSSKSYIGIKVIVIVIVERLTCIARKQATEQSLHLSVRIVTSVCDLHHPTPAPPKPNPNHTPQPVHQHSQCFHGHQRRVFSAMPVQSRARLSSGAQ